MSDALGKEDIYKVEIKGKLYQNDAAE